MFRILCLSLCVYVRLVTSNNQYHQSTCPYSRLNYGSVYGNAPVLQLPNSYAEQYIRQNQNYEPRNSITDLQQMYLKKILANPAIQAFIDPSTKIYNQNGIEISDQILPKTPNVVNNYFIVPTEHANGNFKRKMRPNNLNKVATVSKVREVDRKPFAGITDYILKSDLAAQADKSKAREHKPRANDKKSKKRRISSSTNKEESSSRREKNNDDSPSHKPTKVFDDKIDKVNNNYKRQDTTTGSSTSTVNERVTKSKHNNRERRIKSTETKNQGSEVIARESKGRCASSSELNNLSSKVTLDRELFDVNKECVELDNRNIRNPIEENKNNDRNRQSSNIQDNFMKQWMAYIQSFTPNQNFDSANFKLPYNFEQMYRFPQSSTPMSSSGSDNSNSEPKPRRRKQQRKNKSEGKKITIEVVPKRNTKSEPVLTEAEKENESTVDTPVTKSLEATHYVTDESTENTEPIIYDIIDYFPDFTQDEVYNHDEDDPNFFHNRHFFETKYEDEFNEDDSKHEGKRDSTKQLNKSKRGNDIPTLDTNFKDHRKPVFEDLQFQTPPTLIDPGFETRKVNVEDRKNDKSKSDKTSHTQRSNVETVFARSKVVKYGQHDEEVIEKPKVVQEIHRNDRERKHKSKDRDTAVVFAQSLK